MMVTNAYPYSYVDYFEKSSPSPGGWIESGWLAVTGLINREYAIVRYYWAGPGEIRYEVLDHINGKPVPAHSPRTIRNFDENAARERLESALPASAGVALALAGIRYIAARGGGGVKCAYMQEIY